MGVEEGGGGNNGECRTANVLDREGGERAIRWEAGDADLAVWGVGEWRWVRGRRVRGRGTGETESEGVGKGGVRGEMGNKEGGNRVG